MSNNDSSAEDPSEGKPVEVPEGAPERTPEHATGRAPGDVPGRAPGEPMIESVEEPAEVPPEAGGLLDPWKADAVEAEDRQDPIPGGEPECPLCGAAMVRHVERHPAPRAGDSPFRVRLVCSSEECAAWTVYDW